MTPTDILMAEHRTIEKALMAMQSWGARIAQTQGDDRETLGRFVRFLREFADDSHHRKEEDILFATMVDNGFPREQGPIAVMLFEHVQGREMIAALAELATQSEPWTPADVQRLVETIAGYSGMLGAHIHKEDNILYPMANAHLPAEAMSRMTEQFEQFVANQKSTGKAARLEELAASVIEVPA